MVTLKQLRKKTLCSRPEKGKLVASKYQLIKELGSGGYGSVWKVGGEKAERETALKLLGVFKSKDEYAIDALKNEFSILKDLNHPNICKIYDFGLDELFGFYFVSEYIKGIDFFEATEGKSFEYIEQLLIQTLRALSYIHSYGICHFDIKPSNILIKNGSSSPQAKLIDFGVSTGDSSEATVGTIGYMAPEMILKQEPDRRADLYSIGVLLYESLTRQNPFVDMSPNKSFEKHLLLNPAPPSAVNPVIPKYFDIITAKLLQKNPSDRYQCAEEVLRDVVLLSSNKCDVESAETRVAYIPTEGRIIGRVTERNKLRKFVDDLSSNSIAPITCISGPLGVGKTRLLNDIKYYIQLRGCQSLFVEDSEFLDDTLNRITSSVGSQKKLPKPLFILVDDLSDMLSISVSLENMMCGYSYQLKSGLFPENLGIIYSSNEPDERFSKNQQVITLDNFSRNEVKEFIRAVGDPPDKHVEQIVDEFLSRTRGNPALVTKLCLKLVEQGYIAGGGGRWDKSLFEDIGIDFAGISVPEAIAKSVFDGINSLPEEAIEILECLAVWEEGTEEYNLYKVINEDDLVTFNLLISDLKRRQLITVDSVNKKCCISDEFVRGSLIGSMDSGRISEWHDRISEYLLDNRQTKFYFLPRYYIDKHLAYGTNAEKAHDAILQVAEYERQNGKTAFARKRLEERLAIESKKERLYDLRLELCECLLQLNQNEEIINMWTDTLQESKDLRVHKLLGRALMGQRKYDKAEGVFRQAMDLCGSEGAVDKLVFANYIGRVFMLRGNLDSAIKSYVNSNEKWQHLSQEQRKTVENNQLGEALRLHGNFSEAILRLKEEMEWFEKIKQMNKVVVRQYSLAEAYRGLEAYGQAALYFEKGISLGKKLCDSIILSRLYNGFGGLLISKGDYVQAVTQLERGLSHCYRIGDMHAAATMTLNVGHCYNDLEKLGKAKNYLQLSLHFAESSKTNVQYMDNVLCQTYLELADVLRQEKDFESALDYVIKAEKIANSRGDLHIYKDPIKRVKKRIEDKETAK